MKIGKLSHKLSLFDINPCSVDMLANFSRTHISLNSKIAIFAPVRSPAVRCQPIVHTIFAPPSKNFDPMILIPYERLCPPARTINT
ncbi:hypothetical protein BpHYR1_004632 [Brachionus plicatilis]|uniref:Uncharacterized protein n=1 Tax=Brachionus plicatilis TaxID=10195 RepID=A0A3M7S7N4_BRAPC|nr:hypothetical protein BpHYR1_004632 [Brachionus plicatilis]